jgi:hypothetical protein
MAPPKKPPEEVRKNVLRIRLSEAERAALDQAASDRGEDTSTWARRELLALAGAGRKQPRRRKEK